NASADDAGGDMAADSSRPTATTRPPAVAALDGKEQSLGEHGGTLTILMGRQKDIRMMMVYGYSRLIVFNEKLELEADILKSFDVDEGRIFTFHLRQGHRWSDGHPFTSEAFRYHWQEIVNNKDLFPFGLPQSLLVDDEPPVVEFPDETTVRYTWSTPNPAFLPALAGPRPLFIYSPGHYLEQFHGKFRNLAELKRLVKKAGVRNWAGLHHRRNHPYKFDNPGLPMLQPWINTTPPPAERFVFVRNPYYHRIDSEGRQLPYIDKVAVQIASGSLVPAKAGAGESDLQGRYLRLDNYTFLKESEQRNGYNVRLWTRITGSQFALYPNLNSADPVWRELVRDVRFRRALSLGIDRHEINQVIYYGLGTETNNAVLPTCPLFRPEYQTAWTRYDLEQANRLLDELGLHERDERGVRLLADGRPLEIILHSAGENTEETDILELIGDSWAKLGIRLYTKPSQREVFRERVFSGNAMMAMFNGIDNGLPTPLISPEEFAPTRQDQLQWPKWGQYFETGGEVGEAPDLPEAQRLFELYKSWRYAVTLDEKEEAWHEILKLYTDQVFAIGLVCGVPQPIVVSKRLRNVPESGVWGWSPTAFFGVYRPETFWFAEQ
ncbi:MAG: ABC transporter substrate-binding protein, partial [Pseudomonadota bacterium]|nr:ABC transporter substrate-binding protein [Pseudomonadota bacterium]